jgi:hypothetical protein
MNELYIGIRLAFHSKLKFPGYKVFAAVDQTIDDAKTCNDKHTKHNLFPQ